MSSNEALRLPATIEPAPAIAPEQPEQAKQKNLNVRCDLALFDAYNQLRDQRGLRTNEELLVSLMNDTQQVERLRQQLKEEKGKLEKVVYKDYARPTIAIPEPFMGPLEKIREALKADGNDYHLSGAVNVAIYHLLYDSCKYTMDAEEVQFIRVFLRLGPLALSSKIIKEFMEKDFTLDITPRED